MIYYVFIIALKHDRVLLKQQVRSSAEFTKTAKGTFIKVHGHSVAVNPRRFLALSLGH